MNLSNFGEQFASKVLAKTYSAMITDVITNREYEGEIKKPGDRVNILSFLNDILLSDYVVGSDMASETIIDTEDQLVVEKRRYYNFSLDRLEQLFTYGGDIPANLIENSSKVLERDIDQYVLAKAGDAAVQNWIGLNLVVAGNAGTMASLVTTATGGTITLNGNFTAGNFGVVENPLDGNNYMGGFEAFDIGKGIRLRSTSTNVSPWYKILSVTDSVTATVSEWDGGVAGSDFAEGSTLRGVFGGDGINFPKYGTGDATYMTMSGLGWEFNAAIATSASAAQIYEQITLLSEVLNIADVTDVDRKLTVPPQILTQLKQASELQPTGISEIYSGVVLNGRVMRFGGFEVHMAAGTRMSTRVGKSVGTLSDNVLATGSIGWQILANHPGMITFADKWSESRVVDAENQFAKKYQGLFLFGAKVPAYRRKYGAVLFANF